MLAIKTILHPTDFSPNSQFAFRLACSLANDYKARLILLHVSPPPVIYGEGIVPPDFQESAEVLREKLKAVQATAPEVVMEERLVEGDPATEILRAAEETKCDVILMGTHGRTGLSRLLMGSVAEQVVRKAPCPVVTVKHPPESPPS